MNNINEAIAEITSANHDNAEHGERGIRILRDFQHLEYGTKLYAHPAQCLHQIQEPAVPEIVPPAFLHYAAKKPELHRVDFFPSATTKERASGWVTVALHTAAAEQAACHAGLDEGRAQAGFSVSNATSQHSIACLYGYALARLGLTDTPQMRALFWDAHEALQWDEKTDRYITPSAEGECGQCGHVHEPAPTAGGFDV